jgi:hypothetical protein
MKIRSHFRALVVSLTMMLFALLGQAESPLSGTYIFIQRTTSITKIPVVSDVVATTRAVSIQTLHFDGTWLRGKGDLCSLDIESSSNLVKTTLPPAFRRAVPPIQVDARIVSENGVRRFVQASQTLVLGADLTDKETDALPSELGDKRITDDDGDGKPGVTVKVSGLVDGEIYLVQRSKSQLEGHATEDGFHGKIRFSNEQKILDATRKVLRRDPGAQPDGNRSEFILRRVNAPIDCKAADAIARRLERP